MPLKEHYCTELKVEPSYFFVRQQEPVRRHTHGKIRAKCTYLVVVIVVFARATSFLRYAIPRDRNPVAITTNAKERLEFALFDVLSKKERERDRKEMYTDDMQNLKIISEETSRAL